MIPEVPNVTPLPVSPLLRVIVLSSITSSLEPIEVVSPCTAKSPVTVTLPVAPTSNWMFQPSSTFMT